MPVFAAEMSIPWKFHRYEEECTSASNMAALTATYQQRVLEFIEFINVMRGRYQDATFQEKRNTLDVLSVKVYVQKSETGEKEEKITYSPLFAGTGVQAYKNAQQVVNVVHNAGLATLVVRLKPLIVVKG